jgi:hypothetical protein
MSNALRNTLAVVAGVAVGAVLNGLLITISPSLIPPPEGVDVTNAEALQRGIHLFQPQHFVMPWLAHALGTLVGAIVTYRLAASHQGRLPYLVGGLFFIGGVSATMMIPAPVWFIALDLIGAYFPMAWLATRIGTGRAPSTISTA